MKKHVWFRGWKKKFTLEFKPQDFWIGVFWKSSYDIGMEADMRYARRRKSGIWVSRSKFDVWVCIIPCFPIHYHAWRPW